MPDDPKKGRSSKPVRPERKPNPLEGLKVPRARPGGGGGGVSRTSVPRLDVLGGGSIPVLDHRNSPTPWAAPNNLMPEDDPTRIPDLERGAELSPAEHARTIMANGRTGTLALVVGDPAAPIGFVVNYSTAEDGSPVLCVRNAVERIGCVAHGSPASFSVSETPLVALSSSMTGGVTMLGKLQAVSAQDLKKYIGAHARVHNADELQIQREEAQLYVVRAVAVIMSSGRNELARVNFSEYSNAESDPLATVAPGLAHHLSGDRNGSLVLLARAYGGHPDAKSAQLMGIDRLGLDVIVKTSGGRESIRLGFPSPVSTPEEVRKELDIMVKGARFKLGAG